MLYRIEGTGIKVAGTIPALTNDKPGIPPWLERVVDRTDRLMFEADIEAVDPDCELLPANQSLSVLSFFDLVAAAWQRLQIPGRASRLKAWAAAARVSAYLSGQLAPGVEQLLLPELRRRQPPPEFLELPRDRIAALDAVPLDEQLARLEHLVTRPEEAAAFDVGVHAAWQAQNIDAIDRLLDAQRKLYPETFRHLLDLKHARWLPGLLQTIRGSTAPDQPRTTLVAVEALHLCGEQGIISLLAREGCTLTRLL